MPFVPRKHLVPAVRASMPSTEMIHDAMYELGGIIPHVAEKLGVSTAYIRRRVNTVPTLRYAMVSARLRNADTAVTAIEEIINDAEHKDRFQAAKYVCRLAGLERPTQHDVELSGNTTVTLDVNDAIRNALGQEHDIDLDSDTSDDTPTST